MLTKQTSKKIAIRKPRAPIKKMQPRTFRDFIMENIDKAQPMIGSPDKGIGVRATLPIMFQNADGRWYLEFFCETVLPDSPGSVLGYEPREATFFAGVQIRKILQIPNMELGKPAKSVGEIRSYKSFVKKMIDSSAAQIKLDRVMDHMKNMATPNDEFYGKVNEIWVNRPAGADRLGPPRYRC